MNMMRETITPEEVARRIGRGPDFVKRSLRDGTFPVGTAVKVDGRYSYIIPRPAFERFMRGETVSQTLIERLARAVEGAAEAEGRPAV